MTIRHATMDDLDIISLIETTSFHKTEAAKNASRLGGVPSGRIKRELGACG